MINKGVFERKLPLTIIIAECGLELIPKSLRSHPSIKKNLQAKNYASQLLDTALHHSVMKKLKNFEKRGRPDILHACLLNALGSPLNKSKNLNLYFHTINNKIFKVDPEIRIARNYNRFKGLMAKLLVDGFIGTQDSMLIAPFEGNLEQLIASFEDKEIISCSSKGKLMNNHGELFPEPLSKNLIMIIGGFQKNSFSKNISRFSDKSISISSYSLDAWIVISRIIAYYELVLKL